MKTCPTCGKQFGKDSVCESNRYPSHWKNVKFCSIECGRKSRRGFRKRNPTPCRICGGPTRYRLAPGDPKIPLIRCSKIECIEKSKRRKNDQIGEAQRELVRTGKRKSTIDNWKNVSRIGAGERELLNWMTENKWIHQHHVKTGLGVRNHLPSCFDLDFAFLPRKLYVEIDGSVHRKIERKKRDARKDAILETLGWRGLRIDANLVLSNIEEVKKLVQLFLKSKSFIVN